MNLQSKKRTFVGIFAILGLSIAFGLAVQPGLATTDSEETFSHTFIKGTSLASGVQYLDPAMAMAWMDHDVIAQCVEPLFQVNVYDGASELEFVLATGYEWVDDMTMDITLRENVLFHDNTTFNASAVVWNMARLVNINRYHAGPFGPTFLAPSDVFRELPGVNLDWVPAMMPVDIINSTEAIDEYTVRFNLNIPYAGFISLLANPSVKFLSPTGHADQLNATIGIDNGELYGTGPFKFISHSVIESETIFEGFDEYWQGEPYLDSLIYSFIEDPNTRTNAMLDGTIDTIQGYTGESLEQFRASESIDVLEGAEDHQSFQALWMNVDNINGTMREVLSYAFNYTYLLHEIYDDLAIRAGGALLKGLKYYNSSINLANYNITYARNVLIDEGYVPAGAAEWTDQEWKDLADSESPIATFEYTNLGGGELDMLNILSEGCRLIGINIESDLVEIGEWMQRIVYEGSATVDICFINWGPVDRSVDATSFLFSTYHSTGSFNFARLNDAELDEMIENNYVLTDEAERQANFNAITDKLQNELFPCIYLAQGYHNIVINSYWEGLDPDSTTYYNIKPKNYTPDTDDGTTSREIPGFVNFFLGIVSLGTISVLMAKKRQ